MLEPTCLCVYVYSGAHRGQKKELDAQKLELWTGGSPPPPVWVLELNPGPLQDQQLDFLAQPFLQLSKDDSDERVKISSVEKACYFLEITSMFMIKVFVGIRMAKAF